MVGRSIKSVDKDPFIRITKPSNSASLRLRQSIGSISRYHEDCHKECILFVSYFSVYDLQPEAHAEKQFQDKLSDLKRMILTVKMTQTPLDLNYNGRGTPKVFVLMTNSSYMTVRSRFGNQCLLIDRHRHRHRYDLAMRKESQRSQMWSRQANSKVLLSRL